MKKEKNGSNNSEKAKSVFEKEKRPLSLIERS